MNILLYLSIIFCLLEIASSSFKRRTASTRECIQDTRVSRPPFEVRTLIPLAADVSQLLATYSRPSTEAHRFRLVQWRWHSTLGRNHTTSSLTKYVKKSERREVIYQHLLELLSLSDEKKKQQLTSPEKTSITKHDCYLEVHSTFLRLCDYFCDVGRRRIKTLLARACESDWLNTSTIVHVLTRTYRTNFKYCNNVQQNITAKITTKRIFHTRSYWASHNERRDIFHVYFLDVFSKYNDERKAILSNVTIDREMKGICYVTTHNFFMAHCYYRYYVLGGMKRMRKLLAQACSVEWLNADKIIRVLRTCCQKRFQFVRFDDL